MALRTLLAERMKPAEPLEPTNPLKEVSQ